MKRILTTASIFVLAMVFVVSAFAGSNGKMELKVGDEIYTCNCGENCLCNTMSRNPGKCTCGTDMVKAKVTKVEEGKAYLKAEGWEKERVFKTIGNMPAIVRTVNVTQSARIPENVHVVLK